jgi:hypothetical protein
MGELKMPMKRVFAATWLLIMIICIFGGAIAYIPSLGLLKVTASLA